jgi:hypothetical protein
MIGNKYKYKQLEFMIPNHKLDSILFSDEGCGGLGETATGGGYVDRGSAEYEPLSTTPDHPHQIYCSIP